MLVHDAREGMRVHVTEPAYGSMGEGEIVEVHEEMGLVSVRWDRTERIGEIDAAHIRCCAHSRGDVVTERDRGV